MLFCGLAFFSAEEAEAQRVRLFRRQAPHTCHGGQCQRVQRTHPSTKVFWPFWDDDELEPEPVVPRGREARNEFIAGKLGAYSRANYNGVDIWQAVGKRRVVWRQAAADAWEGALITALRQKAQRSADQAAVVTIGFPHPDAWAVCKAAGVWLSAIDTETGGLVQLEPRPKPVPEPTPEPQPEPAPAPDVPDRDDAAPVEPSDDATDDEPAPDDGARDETPDASSDVDGPALLTEPAE
jgi:hypothetical protein